MLSVLSFGDRNGDLNLFENKNKWFMMSSQTFQMASKVTKVLPQAMNIIMKANIYLYVITTLKKFSTNQMTFINNM